MVLGAIKWWELPKIRCKSEFFFGLILILGSFLGKVHNKYFGLSNVMRNFCICCCWWGDGDVSEGHLNACEAGWGPYIDTHISQVRTFLGLKPFVCYVSQFKVFPPLYVSCSPIKFMRAYEDCRTVNVVYSDKILGFGDHEIHPQGICCQQFVWNQVMCIIFSLKSLKTIEFSINSMGPVVGSWFPMDLRLVVLQTISEVAFQLWCMLGCRVWIWMKSNLFLVYWGPNSF